MAETPPKLPLQMRIASAIVNAVGNASKRRDGTVNRRLLSLVDFRAPPNPVPVDGVSTSDHTVETGSGSASEDWAGFPATMVAIGGMDILQDRQRWYCEGMKGAGVDVCVVEYPNALHGFHCFLNLPEATQLVDDVADFVRTRSQ